MRRSPAIHLVLLPMLAASSLAAAQEMGSRPWVPPAPSTDLAQGPTAAPADDRHKKHCDSCSLLTVRGGFGSYFRCGG